MLTNPEIFKAYDVRGVYPQDINENDAYKIAKAYCDFIHPKEVAVGSDVRISSPSLKNAAIKAITDLKIKVMDIGTVSTDMLYFAVSNYKYSGGFIITASHNPKEYNGMKFVREQSKPISSDTGLFEIRDIASGYDIQMDNFDLSEEDLKLVENNDILEDYIDKIKSFADFSHFKKFKIVANPNFGAAGKNVDKLLENTGIELIKLNWEQDGNFPKGRPDPLIPQNREEISKLVVENKADLGVAWDADADRCFFFTEKGEFIEGYFITALLAKISLAKNPGAKIIHDPRLVWAVQDAARENGGISIISKSGHAFIKEKMRKEDAIFGGEMSAHYYFREYAYCDNGLIPLVMVLEFLSSQNKTFSQIMNELFWSKYFVSGEINNTVSDVSKTIAKVKEAFAPNAKNIDEIDGISIEYPEWRFNLRGSNTEPVIRLNIEAKNQKLMEEKRDEILNIIKG